MTEHTVGRDKRNGAVLVAGALRQEMDRDDRVVVFGEDVAALGGVFGATRQLARRFGPERVFDTPISETAFVGMAVGAAQSGLRPVVELMFADFIGVCFDQVANQMAKNHYMSGGAVTVPLVMRSAVGCIGSAAQHSQVLSGTFSHIPGLQVVLPATPGDLQSLLVTAIRNDDPVVFLEHKKLLKTRVDDLAFNDVTALGSTIMPAPLGQLRQLRDGSDVTIVASGWMVQESLLAAHTLAAQAISVAVVDLRSLVPLDRDGLAEIATRSERILVVDEDYLGFGVTGEVVASIVERIGPRTPPIARLAPDVPVPASRVLEQEVVPEAESIVVAIHRLLERA
ncbi:MAG: alpha-ketoacid dehydrogenase subunit beta [Propionibacteriales bacterium]|nr:alpha-ketoacid dehydrogenase subunit beta [Propionibacteriales bacterium]